SGRVALVLARRQLPSRGLDRRRRAGGVADELGGAQERGRAAAGDQNRLVPAAIFEERLDGRHGVVDVDEVPATPRVARDDDRLARERPGGEGGDRARGALTGDLARPVNRRQPNDQRRCLVEAARVLAEALRVRVGVGWRIERSAYRRRIDEPRAVLEKALEQVERRARVLPYCEGRVLARACGIRDPGEVQDGIAAADQLAGRGVSGVDEDYVFGAGALGAAGPRDGNDLVAVLREQLGSPGAEKAVGAGDEDLHRRR